MALFAISDLHLSINQKVNKSMEVFGARWDDYTEKLSTRWRAVVGENDSVVIPGDISWAMNLGEALDDFRFIDSLPGHKYIGKGNHDFWWSTVTGMKKFLAENGITTIDFLYNNAYHIPEGVICGSRGWFLDEGLQTTVGNVDYKKIAAREDIRLELSLKEAKKLADLCFAESGEMPQIFSFLHFPPVWRDFRCDSFLSMLDGYGVDVCCFGHIHGDYGYMPELPENRVKLRFISSDALDFYPYLLKK